MDPLVRTARTTGLLYLGLAITGGLSFILIRNQIFVPDDPAATLRNLVEHESLARVGIAMEMGVVVTQALVALWFFRLFRTVDAVAAGALAAFGMVNAVVILCSAASLATSWKSPSAGSSQRSPTEPPPPRPCTWAADSCGVSEHSSSACG